MSKQNMITIYAISNGMPMTVSAEQAQNYIGNGWTKTKPKNKTDKKES